MSVFVKKCAKLLRLVGIVVLASFATITRANTTELDEFSALESLKELLETNIATNTRPQDPDLAPGLVLVITSDQIDKAGAQTVGDAIKLIPGVTYQGLFTSPIVRGIGGTGSTASGKIKFQLNGRQFNEPVAATDAGLLELRADAVERIDVIRGPGSAVHGEYALSAVINVITRKDKAIVVGGGSGDSQYAQVATHFAAGDSFKGTLTAGFDEQKGQRVESGFDQAYLLYLQANQAAGGILPIGLAGNAPGPVYDPRENKHIVLGLSYNNYKLDLQYLDHNRGVLFGVGGLDILGSNTAEPILGEKNFVAALTGKYDLSARFDAELEASYSRFDREFSGYEAFPANFLGIYQLGPVTTFSSESVQTQQYRGQLNWYSSENMVTAAGISYSRTQALDSKFRTNFDLSAPLVAGLPAPSAEHIEYPIGWDGINRYIASGFIQQEMLVLEKLNVTVGAHYDHYNDADDNVSPRVALVWQFDENHILKGGLAEAFRAPTFAEKYNQTGVFRGNEDILPEKVRTTELIYIYRDDKRRLEVSVFDSAYTDVISNVTLATGSTYENIGSFDTSGIEVSTDIDITDRFSVGGFISFQNAEDRNTELSYAGTSDWLNGVNFDFRLTENLELSGNFQYVGDRSREAGDSRANLDGYQTLNLSLEARDLFNSGFELDFDVVNALDEEIREPARVNTYIDDYPRAGRAMFVKLSKLF